MKPAPMFNPVAAAALAAGDTHHSTDIVTARSAPVTAEVLQLSLLISNMLLALVVCHHWG